MTASAADHYDVRWRPQGTLAWSNPQRCSPVGEIVVEGLDRTLTYEFEVRAVSACGAASLWVPSDYTVPGAGAPPAVTTLVAVPLADGVHLAWDVDGVQPAGVEFSIERRPSATDGFAERAVVRANAFTDPETTGAEFWYRVRAVNFAGLYGAYSPVVIGSGVSIDSLTAEVSQAQADAEAANIALAKIASDNILSPVEKPVVIRDWNVISAEQAGIDAQAAAFAITTEKTAYDNAVTALANYLGTLAMPTMWNNLAGDTTIVGATFRANFASVYTTRQTLLNAIYAAAKAKADAAQAAAGTAQGTANTSLGQVTQMPVINGGFDMTPTGYGWTADSGSGWTIDTANNTPGVGPNSAAHAAGAGTGAYRNGGLAACLPGQVYKAQGLIKAAGANGACYVYISWCNAAGAEIGTTPGNTISGTTTAGSFAVGTAPAGTVFARTCLGVTGHTAGTYYVDNVLCSQYPSSIGEVPDGGGRHAVNQVDGNGLAIVDFSQGAHVNKNMDNIGDGSSYARVRAGQVSNGIVALLGSGRNAVFNPNFTSNAVGAPNSQPTVYGFIRDGWSLLAKGHANINPLFDVNALGIGFLFGSGIPIPANGQVSAVWYSQPFSVQPGAPFALRTQRSLYLAQAMQAALTAVSVVGVDWYNAQGQYVTTTYFTEKYNGQALAYDISSGAVPSYATTARIQLVGIIRNSYSSAIVTAYGNTAEPLFNSVEFVQQSDLATEVTGTLASQRSLPSVTFANYGSSWYNLTFSYTATTTSATISASAASLYAGSDIINYNASSVTVSGTAGTSATYYLFYDDPTLAGGSQTLKANVSSVTASSNNSRVLLGKVTVTFPSSGSGSGGGTGACPDENAWVLRADPAGRRADWCVRAGDIRVGDYLRLTDGRAGLVTHSKRKASPRVRVVDQRGRALTCSPSAPLELAPGVIGECVAAESGAGAWVRVLCPAPQLAAQIAAVTDAGPGHVQHITCQDAFFWTGDAPDCLFAHHNMKYVP